MALGVLHGPSPFGSVVVVVQRLEARIHVLSWIVRIESPIFPVLTLQKLRRPPAGIINDYFSRCASTIAQ
jgi:hypothetical protein